MRALKILNIAIIISLTITCLDILFFFFLFYYLIRVINQISISNIEILFYTLKIKFYYWIDFSARIGYTVCFIIWFYDTYKALYSIHSDKLRFKPKWAIFGSIIPIAQLIIPFQIMSDLWEHTYNRKMNYSQKKDLVIFWWTVFIIVLIYSRIIASKASQTNLADKLLIYNYHFMFVDVLYIIYLVTTYKLVKMISSE